MVHFFGILQPGNRQAHPGSEAPHKSSFFGGADRPAADRLSPAERDALVLSGRGGEGIDEIEEDHHLIRVATPVFF